MYEALRAQTHSGHAEAKTQSKYRNVSMVKKVPIAIGKR